MSLARRSIARWKASAAGLALALALPLPRPAAAATVRVFAAASFQDALRALASGYEAAHPGARIEFNFAGTQVLRTQIEQGAEADLFASADTEHVNALAREGLAGPATIFAHNALVVVTPARDPRVRGLADLARPGARIVLAGPAVPAGRYADLALRRLGRDPAFGAARESAARANVVSLESNVRGVLSKVELAEADAGFVYETDARSARGRVRAIDLPARDRVTTICAIARLRGSRAATDAESFRNDLLGGHGRTVLRAFGFRP